MAKEKMWEHAKDIAAFANALGGVLLVGANNISDPTVLRYPGVSGQNVADVMEIYQRAGAMCSPSQNVDTVPIKGPRGVDLVAVNVDPHIDQLVASPGGNGERILPSLWRFPIRCGSQTDDIDPEALAMFMNPHVRRAYLMLAAIPDDKRSRVNFWFPRIEIPARGVKFTASWELRLEGVPKGRNFLIVGQTGSVPCRVPLADVLDVWEESDVSWAVKVSGTIESSISPAGSAQVLRYRPVF